MVHVWLLSSILIATMLRTGNSQCNVCANNDMMFASEAAMPLYERCGYFFNEKELTQWGGVFCSVIQFTVEGLGCCVELAPCDRCGVNSTFQYENYADSFLNVYGSTCDNFFPEDEFEWVDVAKCLQRQNAVKDADCCKDDPTDKFLADGTEDEIVVDTNDASGPDDAVIPDANEPSIANPTGDPVTDLVNAVGSIVGIFVSVVDNFFTNGCIILGC